jgi:hypothetical protein
MLTHGCGRQERWAHLRTFVGSAVLVSVVGSGTLAQAQVGTVRAGSDDRAGRIARTASGTIEGQVLDETGGPLPGATVSALGVMSAAVVTDTRGRFAFRLLPVGAYVVRAHLPGFVPSRRQLVDVRPNGYAKYSVSLRRATIVAASFGGAAGGEATMMAALNAQAADGVPGTARGKDASAPMTPATDDHSETAWRIRHLVRSVLKETTERVAIGDGSEALAGDIALPDPTFTVGRLLGTGSRAVSSLFTAFPLAGEVNFLTTGALDSPLGLFSPQGLASSVTYVSVRGPAFDHGDWSARLVIAPADIGSWFFSGAYRTRSPGRHVFDAGASYSLLRYSANPTAPSSETTWSRSAGSVYGIDRWALSRFVTLAYGGSFSRYDYLPGIGLLSPRASLTVVPTRRLRIHATVARRMVAPGAEEFLQPMAEGLWVPAPRSIVTLAGAQAAPVERVHHYEVSLERDLTARYAVTFRTFFQQVTDQQATAFGAGSPLRVNGPAELYTVASTGDLSTRGWGVGLSNAITDRVRGSVWYALTESTWAAPRDGEVVAVVAVGRGHGGAVERNHDLTTQVETEIPRTSTRVFVIYKINTGFARRDAESLKPGFDTRFDVQVTQRLPFLDFTSAQWQVLFAVRNLFRDADPENSIHDELYVIRPPKRIVGGVVVRF